MERWLRWVCVEIWDWDWGEMIELSFVMKIITINLRCYFGHPLYVCKCGSLNHASPTRTRNREHFRGIRNQLRIRSKKIYRVFFKGWSSRFFRSRRHQFFTTQAPVPSKTFRRPLFLSKPAGSDGSGSDSGSAFLFATVGGMGPITFRKWNMFAAWLKETFGYPTFA